MSDSPKVWRCYMLTRGISDDTLARLITEPLNNGLNVNLRRSDFQHARMYHIQDKEKLHGEIMLFQDTPNPESEFMACLMSFGSEAESQTLLFRAFKYWVIENTESLIEEIKFGDKLKLNIADKVLAKNWKGIKIDFAPQTDQNRLKKLELEISAADVCLLSAGERERVVSNRVFAHLYRETGLHASKLPITDLKIEGHASITTDWFRLLRGSDPMAVADIANAVLEAFNDERMIA
ncbi:LAQU0S04e06656g1_1 [Lachancea quebecensis]|uniref:LAQU0S04e06656g1_1 n=1 Tax=Lachancea quebecensis TaxID=1654605 RepID=A0A0P1KQU2_9SACH|nr:LAQU0S04e06656g1_1 [Lachancea quebecensis]